MTLSKHLAKLGGKAVHLIIKKFVIFGFLFYANVAAWGEDVILFCDAFRFNSGTETFYIFQSTILESGEGVGKAGDVFFGKVPVLAVYHVAHVAGINE